jgi:hypothetical protein
MHFGSAVRGLREMKNSRQVTEFQLHTAYVSLFDGCRDKVIDFTERKMRRLIETCQNVKDALDLSEMLRDYKSGRCMIAWRGGNKPISVTATKG